MAFQQLYYTSCERGLSGFAGYQFNAVTPGVGPEVMREVENLTAYEAPRSLPHAPTEGDIAACPVNLCFSPGSTAIIANVAFTGADYSRRLGNYFAHVIVTTTPDLDLGPLLPIELWQASLWSRRTADALELPELQGPLPRGSIDRATVEAFVDAHPGANHLPVLLSAAALAVTAGERSVVLIEPDTSANAQWIAAVSYLLPPAIVRSMSFATYHHRPSYCRLHVIGTIPAADIDAGSAALDSFYLFDFLADRTTKLEIHPLADLLTRVGITGAQRLWDYASSMAAGSETSLDDWYPLAAVAAALDGAQLSPGEFDSALEWFPAEAARMSVEIVSSVCAALLDQAAFGHQHLRTLVTAADAAGASAMLDELELRLIDIELTRLVRDGWRGAPPSRIASPGVRAYVGRQCEAELEQADADTAIRLLTWAAHAEAPLSDQALVACGEQTIGPSLVRSPPSSDLRQLAAKRSWPPLARGVVAYLAAAEPEVATTAFERGLASLLPERDVAVHPGVHELFMITAARLDPRRCVEMLPRILDVRKRATGHVSGADHDLLMRLWPNGIWSISEAQRLLELLHVEQFQAGDDLPPWFTRTILRPPHLGDGRNLDDYITLCRRIKPHPVNALLSDVAQAYVGWVDWVSDHLARASDRSGDDIVDVAQKLVRQFDMASPPSQQMLLRDLPALLILVPLDQLTEVLIECPEPVWERFLTYVRPYLEPNRPNLDLGAHLFIAMMELNGKEHRYGEQLKDRFLADTLLSWKRRDQDKLIDELARIRESAAQGFEQWSERHCGVKSHRRRWWMFQRKPKES